MGSWLQTSPPAQHWSTRNDNTGEGDIWSSKEDEDHLEKIGNEEEQQEDNEKKTSTSDWPWASVEQS